MLNTIMVLLHKYIAGRIHNVKIHTLGTFHALPCGTVLLHNCTVIVFFCLYPLLSVDESESRRRSRLKRSTGLPPVTPNACVKDTVRSLLFDHIWNEIISILHPVLIRIRQNAAKGEDYTYVLYTMYIACYFHLIIIPTIHLFTLYFGTLNIFSRKL
jgi:hypothetical protein